MKKKVKSKRAKSPVQKVKEKVFKAKKKNGKWEVKAPTKGVHAKGAGKKRAAKMVSTALAAPDFESQVAFKGSNDLVLAIDHQSVLDKVLANGLEEALELLCL